MDIITEFWSVVLPLVGEKMPRWAGKSPSGGYWLRARSGVPKIKYDLWVRQKDAGYGLYIDAGSGKDAWNKTVFDKLHNNRSTIEHKYGGPLDWQRLDDARSSVIFVVAAKTGYESSRHVWPDIAQTLVDVGQRFENTLQPHLKTATDAATDLV